MDLPAGFEPHGGRVDKIIDIEWPRVAARAGQLKGTRPPEEGEF